MARSSRVAFSFVTTLVRNGAQCHWFTSLDYKPAAARKVDLAIPPRAIANGHRNPIAPPIPIATP